MEISRRALEGVEGGALLAPAGVLRGTASLSLREAFEREMREGAKALLLDLGAVESIDSATMGFLLDAHERLRARNGTLVLAALSPAVQMVLDSVGLLGFFTVAETVSDAAAALRLGSDLGKAGSGSGSDIRAL